MIQLRHWRVRFKESPVYLEALATRAGRDGAIAGLAALETGLPIAERRAVVMKAMDGWELLNDPCPTT